MVLPVGIEPTSIALQASAMTTSAKAAEFGRPQWLRSTCGWFKRPLPSPERLYAWGPNYSRIYMFTIHNLFVTIL